MLIIQMSVGLDYRHMELVSLFTIYEYFRATSLLGGNF